MALDPARTTVVVHVKHRGMLLYPASRALGHLEIALVTHRVKMIYGLVAVVHVAEEDMHVLSPTLLLVGGLRFRFLIFTLV